MLTLHTLTAKADTIRRHYDGLHLTDDVAVCGKGTEGSYMAFEDQKTFPISYKCGNTQLRTSK